MSRRPIPAYVDARKVFLHHEELTGTIDLENLPRFVESLASAQGIVEVALSFSLNESKHRVIKGSLTAQVEVTCQRCLEPLAIVLNDDINLALFEEESAAKGLDPALDPWISSEYKLVLAELVDEQLMLCMPIVNYHKNEDCLEQLAYKKHELPSPESPQIDSIGNPFAVLKALKE